MTEGPIMRERLPLLELVLARLERAEARQRDYGLHDPDCPKRRSEHAQEGTGAYVVPAECSCWLDVNTVCPGCHARPGEQHHDACPTYAEQRRRNAAREQGHAELIEAARRLRCARDGGDPVHGTRSVLAEVDAVVAALGKYEGISE